MLLIMLYQFHHHHLNLRFLLLPILKKLYTYIYNSSVLSKPSELKNESYTAAISV